MVSITLANDSYRNFEAALYIRVYEVQQMKDLSWLESRWNALSKQVKFSKVYIETHRDMIVADEETISKVRKFFESKGIRTSGGITTTVNERNQFQTFCYTNSSHRQKVKEVVEFTARLFDEVILDDFFFTNCKCESCIRAKGDKSWTRFRLDLMAEAARDLVIQPARAVNPKVRLIIKYPNWYDHYQYLGFNLEVESKLFDAIYTGTETRDPVYGSQHLQPYQGYSIFRFLENVKPGGNAGGWVDPPLRGTLDRYAEQLWLTLFAKAPEITLFDFRQLVEPVSKDDGTVVPETMVGRLAGYVFDQVDGILGKLGRPVGVKSYKPCHSSGEDFLHCYIGMLGIPMEVTPVFPADAKTIFLTESAKFDGTIVAKIKKQLADGKNVVITSGLLKALAGKGIEDIAELEYTDKKAVTREFMSHWSLSRSESDIVIPQIRYATNDAWETITCLTKGTGYPILLQASYANGQLYVLTIPESFGDLYNLPVEVLTAIQEVVMKDLPVRMESPSQVSLFVYDNNTFIVESFLPHASSVRIVVDKHIGKLRELLSGREFQGQLRGEKRVFETYVWPHSYSVFAAEPAP
jgi:hypothetical protein